MYVKNNDSQSVFDFVLPFGGKLSPSNRWVTKAKLVPWQEFEARYSEQFSKSRGAPAKPFRLALGTLIIKECMSLSDSEVVEQLRRNLYLYFMGPKS